MKLWGMFRFELGYQLRRPWPWLIAAALLVFSFLFTRDGQLSAVQYADFYINAPFPIAAAAVFTGVLWLMAGAAIAGEAAARDVSTGMHPLTYTLPLSRRDYLGGRFLAALTLNALILLVVPVGGLLGVYLPGVHPDAIGPFRPAAYLTAYAFIALPNAFAATSIQFSLALRSGRPMAAYLGSLLLFFLGFFVASLLLYRRGLGTLLDPIGIRFFVEDVAHLWTTAEKNTRLLAFDGIVARNRLVWLGIGAGTLAITYLRFRFAHRTDTAWWRRWRRSGAHTPPAARLGVDATRPISVPDVPRRFGPGLRTRQVIAIARDSFGVLARSWAGLGMLIGVPLLTVLVVLDGMSSVGAPLMPATGQVLKELTGPISSEMSRWVIVPPLILFFAGELIWREREDGLGEITDATPVPESVPLLGKLLGLALMLAVFMACLMAAGMLAQLIMGYHRFEIGLYLEALFGLQLPEYLLFAALALAIHALVDQKYVGHLVGMLAFVFILLASMFGVEHDLLIYGAGPGWTYTEMSGFGPYVRPWLWFRLYWGAWALLLLVAARVFWARGREPGLAVRLRLARQRLTRATVGVGVAAVVLILGLGGFIFYNTNVLNEYLSASQRAERSAEYERRYARFANMPQPRLASTRLRVEIYPERGEVDIRGSYRLVNQGELAIDTIHLADPRGSARVRTIAFDRPATLVVRDREHGHRIYALRRPLQPGDSVRLDFQVRVQPHGFSEGGIDGSVVPNGTLFTQGWLPTVGYQRDRELLGPLERREHGLAARPVIPSLYDAEARKGSAGGTAFDAVLGTDADQVAVAPGALRRSWTERGRRYFHYSTDAPIGREWVFASAHYAVREARWRDVVIRVLHHPAHSAHPEGMIRSIQASLDYYSRRIGPYPYRHITVAEVPGNGVGVHADASMLTHGEGVTFLRPKDDPRSLDLPFAVLAHEMAHQWAVPSAFVEGAPVLSESLAWYYAMQVVEHERGSEQLHRLMSFMRQPYPHAPIRRGEPLLRGLDPYMSYRRGPFALYALEHYIGRDHVNAALRRMWEAHRREGAPLTTTLDLYRELQAETPDSLRYLLHDLFEVNTFWELDTERVTAQPTREGAWRVTMELKARKVVYDTAGVETRLPMDEWVQIGVFGPRQPGHGSLSAPLYLRPHRIRAGDQTITVTVPRRPVLAGIDPFHVLDWEEREDDNNVEEVSTGS